MTKILLVHGINNQDNSKANIENTWSDSIRKGAREAGITLPNDIRFSAAFYGDLLDEETNSWKKNKSSSTPMSAASPDDDFADDNIAALYLEFQQKYNVEDDQIAKELDVNDDLRSRNRMAKGVHKRWLKAIARILENVLPSNGKGAIKAFLTQASAYLHKPELKEKIDDLVREQILDDLSENEEVIIISHSLGTVVTYDLMRRFRHKIKVKLLITAGSPLGVKVIKRRLGMPLICLPNVKRWVNISDKEDFVALRAKLTQDNFGCGNIINYDEVDNGEEDAHDILQYLLHEDVVREIQAAIDS